MYSVHEEQGQKQFQRFHLTCAGVRQRTLLRVQVRGTRSSSPGNSLRLVRAAPGIHLDQLNVFLGYGYIAGSAGWNRVPFALNTVAVVTLNAIIILLLYHSLIK